MKWCCMPCPVCGQWRSQYLTPRPFRNTGSIMTESWTMWMLSLPIMQIITSMWQVNSHLTGHTACFAFQVWLSDWLQCPPRQLNYGSHYNFDIIFMVAYMVSCLISVPADDDLLKYVLECSALLPSLWMRDHPSDTEDEAMVRLLSEDEAEGLETQPGVARRGAGVSAAVLAEPQPAGDEVLVKKRTLKRVMQ